MHISTLCWALAVRLATPGYRSGSPAAVNLLRRGRPGSKVGWGVNMHNPRELAKMVRHNLEVVQSFRPDGEAPTEVEADRALRETGGLLRVLDNALSIGRRLQDDGDPPLGTVLKQDGQEEPLFFRDVTNKLTHARRFDWRHGDSPAVICTSEDPNRWLTAEIDLTAFVTVCERVLP